MGRYSMPGRPICLGFFFDTRNRQATDFVILDGLDTGILHRMGLPVCSYTALKFMLLLGSFSDAYPKGLRISRDSPLDTK
jgi:hypothetical protein